MQGGINNNVFESNKKTKTNHRAREGAPDLHFLRRPLPPHVLVRPLWEGGINNNDDNSNLAN